MLRWVTEVWRIWCKLPTWSKTLNSKSFNRSKREKRKFFKSWLIAMIGKHETVLGFFDSQRFSFLFKVWLIVSVVLAVEASAESQPIEENCEKLIVKKTKGEKVFKKNQFCPTCNKELAPTTSMELHNQRMHSNNIRNFECTFNDCLKKFKTKRDLDQHNKIIHQTKKMNPLNGLPTTTEMSVKLLTENNKHSLRQKKAAFRCCVCDRDFLTERKMRNHQSQVHLPKFCYHCCFSSPRKADLKRHLLALHSKVDHLFKCSDCPKSFKTNNELTSHLRSHNSESDYIKQNYAFSLFYTFRRSSVCL